MSRYSKALQDAAESARLLAVSSIDPMWALAHGVSGPQSLVSEADASSDGISVRVIPHGSFAVFGDGSQEIASVGPYGRQHAFTIEGIWRMAASGDGVSGTGAMRREDYRMLGAGAWSPLSAACARSLSMHGDAIRSALLEDAMDRRSR